jgi:hypothetical protein
MQAAKRHPDKDKLEKYLDSLVPNFRRSIMNRLLGDAMFPKLKASVSFPNGRPLCCCVMHETLGPEGLNWFTPWLIVRSREEAEIDEESEDGVTS